MNMKHIIALSGDIGGGKSSVATALQQLTGYENALSPNSAV
jgi:deoxyadenosine/deoxycytidine kinase